MPQRKSGLKELRKTYTRRMQNLDIKTDLRKTLKQFMTAVDAKNKADAQTLYKTLAKKFDKAAKRKIVHKNTASRRKSRFSKLVAAL